MSSSSVQGYNFLDLVSAGMQARRKEMRVVEIVRQDKDHQEDEDVSSSLYSLYFCLSVVEQVKKYPSQQLLITFSGYNLAEGMD